MRPIVHGIAMLSLILTCGCEAYFMAIREPWEKSADAADDHFFFQQYDLAAEEYRQAIADVEMRGRKIERFYLHLSGIYKRQGKYCLAVETMKKCYNMFKERLSLQEHYYYAHDIGEILFEQGKYHDVLIYCQNAIRVSEPLYKRDYPNDYIAIYPLLSEYDMALGDYEKSIQLLKEHLDVGVHKEKANFDWIARAKYYLARAYFYAGDEAAIEELFNGNATQKLFDCACSTIYPEDIVGGATIVGRIFEHRGQYDNAYKTYRKAYEALGSFEQNSKMMYRMEQADVLNQVGRFQLKQNRPEESSKAYHEASALRQATGTATHPNCADAYKGLADVSAYKGELTSATLQATKALEILDASVVPTHPRTAQELVTLASIHVLSGHPEQANPLKARLETILQKPMGPWKEDFLETTSFYAGLLKNAGKTADAERLEQLHARQKDKR